MNRKLLLNLVLLLIAFLSFSPRRALALVDFVKSAPVTPFCSNPKWIHQVLTTSLSFDESALQAFYKNFELQLENQRRTETLDQEESEIERESERMSSPIRIDRILVEKSKNKLHLLSGTKLFKSYSVSLGFSPTGNKVQEGDGKTPEGLYKIEFKNPNSAFHLALKLSYPNERDEVFAKKRKVSPGGFIMIHGFPTNSQERKKVEVLHGKANWTEGCMGMTDSEIEEVYPIVDKGTPVEICP